MGKAPTITEEGIKDQIEWEYFHVVPETTLTICVLKLRNGFTVTGEASCVHSDNFDATKGRELAYKEAFDKIWQLEGYRLCCELSQEAGQ